MKVRIGAAALLAFLALTACTSSTNGKGSPFQGGGSAPASTPPLTTSTQGSGFGPAPTTSDTASGSGGSSAAFCTKLEQAQTSLGEISSSMSDPSKAKDLLNEEAAIFNNLEKNAPAEIAPALHDLSTVMSAAAKYFENPGAGSTSALQDLGTKLPDDIEKIGTYVAANCH